MKRKLLSVLMALCLILTLLPTAVFAEELTPPEESGEQQEEQAQLKIRLNQNQTEWEKLSKKINKLKRKKLTYPSGVELLVESVQEDL